MYIKKHEFEAIERALRLINYNNLKEDEKEMVVNADSAMVDVLHRNKVLNQKTARYIANKRKENKNYARKKKQDSI